MRTTPEQNKGIAATIMFHFLLMLLLFFLALRTPLPLPGEEGVEIRMGNSDEGTFSENIEHVSASSSTTPASPSSAEEIVTQTEEETIALETSTKPQPHQKPEEKPETKPETKPQPEVKPDPKPAVDPRALYPGNNAASSGGGTGTSGDYGRPDGTSTTGGLTGGGQGSGQGSGSGSGSGAGGSWTLRGRDIKLLKEPSYNSGEQGHVAVKIRVDKNGNVVEATAGTFLQKNNPDLNTDLKTTITDKNLWKQAEEAALQSKFSPDDKATERQTGYIVYHFVKQ